MCVRAWLLAEGDVLPDGERVVSVQRDPAAQRVVLATDDGRRRMLYREDRLVMAYRAAADVTTRHGGRCAFLAGGRRMWLRSRRDGLALS